MKSESNRLIALLFLMGLLGLFIILYFYLEYLNPVYLVLVCVVIQQLYTIPMFCGMYSELFGVSSSWTRWVPGYNEVEVFPPMVSRISFWINIFILIGGLLLALPYIGVDSVSLLVAKLFGDLAAMDYLFYTALVLLVLYLLSNLVRGSGYYLMLRAVQRIYTDKFSESDGNIMRRLYYLMVFFPFLRTVAIQGTCERLRKMLYFNDIFNSHEEFEESGGYTNELN